MSNIEHRAPEKMLPLEYPEGYRYTVKQSDKAIVIDIRQYSLPFTYETEDISWIDGAKLGTFTTHIDREINWDSIDRDIEKAFSGVTS